MRKIIPLFILVFSSLLPAQDIPKFELGAILGVETGLSAKYWYTPRTALDAAVAWAFGDVGMFSVHGDYLVHSNFFNFYNGDLALYTGVGSRVRISDDWFVKARIPFGTEYLFPNQPLSMFAEIVPGVEVLPETVFRLGGGIGVRVTLGKVNSR